MSDVIRIKPTRTSLPGARPALEISLGGAPRGLVVLFVDPAVPEIDVVETMNTFAGEGFESLALATTQGVADQALARAAERGWNPDQVGVVGIGSGATVALTVARTTAVGAAVSLSPVPDIDAVVRTPKLVTPWLGLFGAESVEVADNGARRLARALEQGSDVYSRVVVYPGVGRDFYRRSESGVSFAASYDGWQRTIEWLHARVAARLTPLAVAWREQHPVPN